MFFFSIAALSINWELIIIGKEFISTEASNFQGSKDVFFSQLMDELCEWLVDKSYGIDKDLHLQVLLR